MDGSSPDKVCCRDRGHSLPPISGKTMDSSRLGRLDGGLELLPGTWRECLGSDNCVPWEEAVPAVAAVAAATLPLAVSLDRTSSVLMVFRGFLSHLRLKGRFQYYELV